MLLFRLWSASRRSIWILRMMIRLMSKDKIKSLLISLLSSRPQLQLRFISRLEETPRLASRPHMDSPRLSQDLLRLPQILARVFSRMDNRLKVLLKQVKFEKTKR